MLSSGLGAYGLGFRIGGLGFPGLGVCRILHRFVGFRLFSLLLSQDEARIAGCLG